MSFGGTRELGCLRQCVPEKTSANPFHFRPRRLSVSPGTNADTLDCQPQAGVARSVVLSMWCCLHRGITLFVPT